MPVKQSKTTSAHKIRAQKLTEGIEMISFDDDVSTHLSRLNGILIMEFSGEGAIQSRIVDRRTQEPIMKLTELQKLSGYNKFVNEKINEVEKGQTDQKRTVMYSNALKQYNECFGTTIGNEARMLESNVTRFEEFRKNQENTEYNLSVIQTLPDSDYKTYILQQGEILSRIFSNRIIACMGSDKVEKDSIDPLLLGCGIPQSLMKFLIDKEFSKDASRRDAKSLLFPKGNYSNSISFCTKEIEKRSFVRMNETVARGNDVLFFLAKSDDFKGLFISQQDEDVDALNEKWQNIKWPLLMQGTVEEYLQPRLDGVSTKSNGGKFQIITNDLSRGTKTSKKLAILEGNVAKIVSVVLDYCHYLPRVSDPVGEIWSQFFTTSAWQCTPDKTVYNWISEESDHVNILNTIKGCSSESARKYLAGVIVANLGLTPSSTMYKKIFEIFKNVPTQSDKVGGSAQEIRTERNGLITFSKDDLENSDSFVAKDSERVSNFRGRETKNSISKKEKKKRGGRNAVRGAPQVTATLKGVSDKELRKELILWAQSNFKEKKVQVYAAELAAGAVQGKDELDYEDSDSESESEEETSV